MTLRAIIHICLHVAVPATVAWMAFRASWRWALLIMLATMLVDLDHLLARPIFDADRCSIGFHPLHSYWAIGLYVLLALPARSRLVGVGLLIHMVLDALDCTFM